MSSVTIVPLENQAELVLSLRHEALQRAQQRLKEAQTTEEKHHARLAVRRARLALEGASGLSSP